MQYTYSTFLGERSSRTCKKRAMNPTDTDMPDVGDKWRALIPCNLLKARKGPENPAGLQAHPPLSFLESIDLTLRRFFLCPLRARYLLQAFTGFHDPACPLAQFADKRRIVFLDGFDGVPEQLCYVVG
jgi:hypothetical protein